MRSRPFAASVDVSNQCMALEALLLTPFCGFVTSTARPRSSAGGSFPPRHGAARDCDMDVNTLPDPATAAPVARARDSARRLWQAPVFVLGISAFLGVWLLRP